jgi:hypothetical protein
MSAASDPDLQHLIELLDLLPGPDERHFWEDLPSESRTDYLLEKLVPKISILHKSDPLPVEVEDLTKYLMMFFHANDAAMYDYIGRHTYALPYELAGRHWLGDLQATCWRLYVRYQPGGARLSKWPHNFRDWLGQQRAGDHE